MHWETQFASQLLNSFDSNVIVPLIIYFSALKPAGIGRQPKKQVCNLHSSRSDWAQSRNWLISLFLQKTKTRDKIEHVASLSCAPGFTMLFAEHWCVNWCVVAADLHQTVSMHVGLGRVAVVVGGAVTSCAGISAAFDCTCSSKQIYPVSIQSDFLAGEVSNYQGLSPDSLGRVANVDWQR